jgi:hypothetical protein
MSSIQSASLPPQLKVRFRTFVLEANKKVMSFHRSGNSSRKKKPEYIPEEKYDVDGTLIKNEEAFKKKRWDLKDIVRT